MSSLALPVAASRLCCAWSHGLRGFRAARFRSAAGSLTDYRQRDIAMVFQCYALYPHMTVAQNMAFSLRMNRVNRGIADAKVAQAAEMLGLTNLLGRYPRELSGGQRQRVAMGRAVVRNPAAFLFDEPLSNLDAKLRVQVRAENQRAPPARAHDNHLCHPRPGGGDDDGRHDRRDARRQGRAAERLLSSSTDPATPSWPSSSARHR